MYVYVPCIHADGVVISSPFHLVASQIGRHGDRCMAQIQNFSVIFAEEAKNSQDRQKQTSEDQSSSATPIPVELQASRKF